MIAVASAVVVGNAVGGVGDVDAIEDDVSDDQAEPNSEDDFERRGPEEGFIGVDVHCQNLYPNSYTSHLKTSLQNYHIMTQNKQSPQNPTNSPFESRVSDERQLQIMSTVKFKGQYRPLLLPTNCNLLIKDLGKVSLLGAALKKGRGGELREKGQQFYFMAERKSWKKNQPKSNKYDDWVCLFCHNHNYSFRNICNRCHLQTKEHNSHLTILYQQQLQLGQALSSPPLSLPHTFQGQQVFPNVLLLVINEQPWEESPQMRQANKSLNLQWIHHLIED